MRVFCASIATETNTFAPLRTDFIEFQQSFYAPPGAHPETPTLCSAVFPALRKRARRGEIELIEGTATWAEPGGLVNAKTWARLRDEVLDQLRAALPVDAVVLGLHGAMMADGTDDCEGELLEAARRIAGPDAVIGASFDPHSHLTAKRVANLDVLTVFKEFPHTDFVEAGEACADLVLRTARGEIRPAMSVFDIRMMDVLPTSRQPMRGFVDRIRAMEGEDGILSISLVHGFMAADVADLGAKIVVITDDRKAEGERLARELGMEVFSFRGRARPEFLAPREALARAAAHERGPVVIADVWDNPGGGVPGDSTIMTRLALDMGLEGVAVGPLWDPMAVRLCHAAGKGAHLQLRFGGKTSAVAGDPIDAEVEILETVRDAVQSFGDSIVPLGDAAAIRVGGVDVVLNSNRAQGFSPDLFSNLGIDPLSKKILIVKSTNHFYGAFAPIASQVLYAEVKGPYPSDPRTNGYTKLTRPIWPVVENPHAEEKV
ncbi:microcystin LR degradation protein MlrC-like protein [Paramesorhizobium deserti]|uniref:Microcystinase C n=1 Tax=Paramesorhizobium deserti TaxID=1494590 RepID=A0A135HYZ6_9HYPH|nr:M81 family metallopeptidase [Paramesorhizobium deserti]KXF78440.1 microcystin LR degradation protein MlrC-like protein [Paramesorhizobium deserti]